MPLEKQALFRGDLTAPTSVSRFKHLHVSLAPGLGTKHHELLLLAFTDPRFPPPKPSGGTRKCNRRSDIQSLKGMRYTPRFLLGVVIWGWWRHNNLFPSVHRIWCFVDPLLRVKI